MGHRDLVREFTDACRRQNIKPGLYFTTTDTYNKDNPNKAQIQLDQMTELTTEYGDDIAYFWYTLRPCALVSVSPLRLVVVALPVPWSLCHTSYPFPCSLRQVRPSRGQLEAD